MKRVVRWVVTAGAVGALALLLGVAVPGANAQTQAEPEVLRVDDQKLDAFARAYVDIQELRLSELPEAEEATDPAETQELLADAESRTREILEREGLTAAEYSAILATVNANDDLREETLSKVEDVRND